MAVIEIGFACGHDLQTVDVDKVTSPVCPQCGESRVMRVTAPAPRITGCASGPLVQTKALPAIAVPLAETPLVLHSDADAKPSEGTE